MKSKSSAVTSLPLAIASSMAFTSCEPLIENVTDSDELAAYAVFTFTPTFVKIMAAASTNARNLLCTLCMFLTIALALFLLSILFLLPYNLFPKSGFLLSRDSIANGGYNRVTFWRIS